MLRPDLMRSGHGKSAELTELSVRMLEEEFGDTIPVCRCAAVAEICDQALVFTDHRSVGIIDKRSDVF